MQIFFVLIMIVLSFFCFTMAVVMKARKTKKDRSDDEPDIAFKNDKTDTSQIKNVDKGETNMTCKICGNETTELSSKQICLNCLQDFFDKIQAGGNTRKKAIAQIDSMFMEEIMSKSILAEHWNVEDLTKDGQRDRRDRGLSKSCKLLEVNALDQSAEFFGSKGDVYQTTLTSCTCIDFSFRVTPCKHIFRLAAELENKK